MMTPMTTLSVVMMILKMMMMMKLMRTCVVRPMWPLMRTAIENFLLIRICEKFSLQSVSHDFGSRSGFAGDAWKALGSLWTVPLVSDLITPSPQARPSPLGAWGQRPRATVEQEMRTRLDSGAMPW